MGKTLKKSSSSKPQGPIISSFHILCVAMYSGPLYKSCQPCPWGPYGSPGGGGGGGVGGGRT